MKKVFITRAYLYRLRNEVPFGPLFRKLGWPHKRVGNQLRFVCPVCGESQTSVNPATNLARCFHCELNWNPIDFTIKATNCEFTQAIAQLEELLPNPQQQPPGDDSPSSPFLQPQTATQNETNAAI